MKSQEKSIQLNEKSANHRLSANNIKKRLASHALFSQRTTEFICLMTGLLIATWFAISIGASSTDFLMPLKTLYTQFEGELSSDITHSIVMNIRLPRVVMAILVGATLAVSGASLQGLCRNSLADPGLLGISSGAAVGAVLMILFAQYIPVIKLAGSYAVAFSAFLGATVATFSVYRLAQENGNIQIPMFLLAGVAINSLCAAIISGLSFIADDQALRLITFWMMGSLASATWTSVCITAPLVTVSIIAIFKQRHALNLILLGEANARFTGIDVKKVKTKLLWLNAFSVGVVVSFSGIIGFIGLVVPHILRMSSDTNYRYLILNSAILGGALLVVADVSSRMIITPAELPIGILTSLIGAPFFIALLIQQKKRGRFGL